MPTRSGKKFAPSQVMPALSKENEHASLAYIELVDLHIVLESLIENVAREGHHDSKELKFFCDRQNEVQAILLRLSSPTVVPRGQCDDVIKRSIGCVLSDLQKSLPFNKERKMLLNLETFVEFFVVSLLKKETENHPLVGHPIRELSRRVKATQVRLSYAAMDNDISAFQMDERYFNESLEARMMQYLFGSGYIPERKEKKWTERAEFLDRLTSNILSNLEIESQKSYKDFYLLQYYLKLFKTAKSYGILIKLIPSKILESEIPDEQFKKKMITNFPMIWDHEHAPAA